VIYGVNATQSLLTGLAFGVWSLYRTVSNVLCKLKLKNLKKTRFFCERNL